MEQLGLKFVLMDSLSLEMKKKVESIWGKSVPLRAFNQTLTVYCLLVCLFFIIIQTHMLYFIDVSVPNSLAGTSCNIQDRPIFRKDSRVDVKRLNHSWMFLCKNHWIFSKIILLLNFFKLNLFPPNFLWSIKYFK